MKLNGIMKKTAALTLAAACLVPSLSGCSSTKPAVETATAGESVEKTGDNAAPSADAPVEITFTVWDYGTTDYWKVLVEAFEKENPDIKVKVTDIGGTDYDTKIPVLLSSGDTSDVITIKSMPIYTSLVEKNQLMPLDEMVAKSGLDMSPYLGSDEGIKMNGSLYGLPFRNDYYLLYYNKTLFDNAGLSYPTNDMTWDEYRKLAKELTTGEGNDKNTAPTFIPGPALYTAGAWIRSILWLTETMNF